MVLLVFIVDLTNRPSRSIWLEAGRESHQQLLQPLPSGSPTRELPVAGSTAGGGVRALEQDARSVTDGSGAAVRQAPRAVAPPRADEVIGAYRRQFEQHLDCALEYRPGNVPRARHGAWSAWMGARGPSRARLDRFFAKLIRGEKVQLYFLGESVTRGSGASHECNRCTDAQGNPPPFRSVHNWVNRSLVGGPIPSECVPTHSKDPYMSCSRIDGVGSCPDNTTVCFPRNSWRCLMVHWLQHAFPGQVEFRISAKPMLFMASCFARSLTNIDLVIHEYAVNGGGRMLCLQERILRAALLGALEPAVLVLLWVPKHYRPPPPETQMVQVQEGLRSLGAHYNLPTLRMTEAFAAQCPPGVGWCYERNESLGGAGFLHSDMYHPNEDGHSFFAAHVIDLLERSLSDVRRFGAPRRPVEPPRLPRPLHDMNGGLDDSAEGGVNLCLSVDEMQKLAAVNNGWEVVTEVTKANVKRLPALQTDGQGSSIEWTLDVRGVIWLIVTYMQSYAGFATLDLQCISGCSCRLHANQASADVNGVGPNSATVQAHVAAGRNLINATNDQARTSEPQWRIVDLSNQTEKCVVRASTVSPGKFKLMLLSLIRVGGLGDTSEETQRKNTRQALQCFGVHDYQSPRGHGMIKPGERIKFDHLVLDETTTYTKDY